MDLIARSRAGDQQAFAALFHQYKNLVYKTAYLMLGNANDAEETLQEVFIQVHRALCSYDPSRGAFTTWLHRITVNHCLNRRRKPRSFMLPLDELPASSQAALSTSPDETFGDREAVQQALGNLSEKLRAVVVLRFFWELSHVEISQVLSIPVGTVKSRLDLALRTLRKELDTTAEDAARHGASFQKEVSR